jgi:hypothetical protein
MNGRRLAVRANLLVGALLMLVVWVLLVWVASRPALRRLIDLTPQQVNSVDPATEDLLHELRAQQVEVEFHLFFPAMAGQAADDEMAQVLRIRDRLRTLTKFLLRRYQWLGGEVVKIREYDLQSDLAATREAAQAFGYTGEGDVVVVTARQPGRERRFRSLSLLSDLAEIELPGLRGNAGPAALKVPTLKRYLGEVVLSSALKGLLVQGTPVAYVLRGYSRFLDTDSVVIGSAYGKFVRSLQSLGFDVRDLTFGREHVVPRDAALVLVLEPDAEFSDVDAVALFDYCKRGGRLFLNYAWSPIESRNPDGGKLGELLGYTVGQAPVFHMIPDPSGRVGGPGLSGHPAVAKLQLDLSPTHEVTRRLALAGARLEIGGARALDQRPGAAGELLRSWILRTGPYGWLGRPGPDGQPDLQAPPQNLLMPFLVGLAIEVPAAAAAAAAEGGKPPTGKGQNGQVVIVSGAFANNSGVDAFGDLGFNICNWLAERRVLMDIQTRAYAARQMQVQPQQQDRIRWLCVYGVPGGFLLCGAFVLYRRRRT